MAGGKPANIIDTWLPSTSVSAGVTPLYGMCRVGVFPVRSRRFRRLTERPWSAVHRLGRGVDVKGEGGYVVAAPSRHKSGARYAWVGDGDCAPVLEAPVWLLERVCVAPGERAASHTGSPLPSRGCAQPRPRILRDLARADLVARASAYLATMPEAVSGQGGHHATMRAAIAATGGFGDQVFSGETIIRKALYLFY